MTFIKGQVPPGATPFKQGQSGNPSGKPKGAVSRNTIAKRLLALNVKLPEEVQEKIKEFYPNLNRRISFEEAMTLVQIVQAMKGDNQSYKLVLDSAYGNPKQEVDMVGEIKITDHKLTIEVIPPPEED